jgi:hypothetical protein
MIGAEHVTYGWCDCPDPMHEMMEFIADFTIGVFRRASLPILLPGSLTA